ncbi:hypothetical protein GCM10023116_43500 [Kistimonas scapharcae]|uniref:Uncharacterized protein n=1 Tax=Kistimonas scapharcae TaxID=1036133 RepID=A0ABP8V8K9_9GAMM
MLDLRRLNVRDAICAAYGVQMKSKPLDLQESTYQSTKGTKPISNSLIADGIEAGKVIAAVESLPKHLRAWAVWAYAPRVPEWELPAQGVFFQWFADDVAIRLLEMEKVPRAGTADRIRSVSAWAALNWRDEKVSGKRPYSEAVIQKACGIQRQNWKRDYLCWYEWACGLCRGLDSEALAPVSAVLTAEKAKARAEYLAGRAGEYNYCAIAV